MRAIKIHAGKSALRMEFNTDCLALFALQVIESFSHRIYSNCLRKVLHEKGPMVGRGGGAVVVVGRFELPKPEGNQICRLSMKRSDWVRGGG